MNVTTISRQTIIKKNRRKVCQCAIKKITKNFEQETIYKINSESKQYKKCKSCREENVEKKLTTQETSTFLQALKCIEPEISEVSQIIICRKKIIKPEEEKNMPPNDNLEEVCMETESSDENDITPAFQSELTPDEMEQILYEASMEEPQEWSEEIWESLQDIEHMHNNASSTFDKTQLDQDAINRIFEDLIKGDDVVDHNSKYRSEAARVASFKNWPCLFLTPGEMAAAGFYYTGDIDRVKCFECCTEICRWEATDDPMTEHRRWGGRCAFLRHLPCGNIPLDPPFVATANPAKQGEDTCGRYIDGAEEYAGISEENAKYVLSGKSI